MAQDDQALSPSEIRQLTKVSEPATLYKGYSKAGFNFNFQFIDKIFDKNGTVYRNDNSFGRSWSIPLSFQYGITNRLQVEVVIPYQNKKISNTFISEIPETGEFETNLSEGAGKGMGDLELVTRFQILKPVYNKRFLTFTATVELPTGKSEPSSEGDLPVGNGYTSVSGGLDYTRIIYPFRFSLGGSYKYISILGRSVD